MQRGMADRQDSSQVTKHSITLFAHRGEIPANATKGGDPSVLRKVRCSFVVLILSAYATSPELLQLFNYAYSAANQARAAVLLQQSQREKQIFALPDLDRFGKLPDQAS